MLHCRTAVEIHQGQAADCLEDLRLCASAVAPVICYCHFKGLFYSYFYGWFCFVLFCYYCLLACSETVSVVPMWPGTRCLPEFRATAVFVFQPHQCMDGICKPPDSAIVLKLG